MSRSISSASLSPFWSIASTAELSPSARAARTRSALVVLPVPVPPHEKMCCPPSRGSRGPSSSPVIGTYGSCPGQGRVRMISPWERMYTRSPGRRFGRAARTICGPTRGRGAPRRRRGRRAATDARGARRLPGRPRAARGSAARPTGGPGSRARTAAMRRRREVEVARRERRPPPHQPRPAGTHRSAHPERGQARRERDHVDRPWLAPGPC